MKDIVKITVIGGGSRQWAITLIKDLTLQSDFIPEICLYDINIQSAIDNVGVAERIFSINKTSSYKVYYETNLDKALSKSNFVVISIEPGIIECRYGDLVLPSQYGILQTVGDTTGPGGIMRARRAIPLFFEFAKHIKANCPDAWVINYTNPMTLCCEALYSGFDGIKLVGCCHEVFHTQTFLANKCKEWFNADITRKDIECDVSGLNHFTFMPKAFWNGNDLIAKTKDYIKDSNVFADRTALASEWKKNGKWFECEKLVALTFLRDYGVLGAAGDRHLAEFVPFFLTSESNALKLGFTLTPYTYRIEEDAKKHSKKYADEELVAKKSDEEGVDIMLALLGFGDIHTNINTLNDGQVEYLPKGCVSESMAYISCNSVKPEKALHLTPVVEEMEMRIAEEQNKVLSAILCNNDNMLFEAFCSDPLVNLNKENARELFDKMLFESRLRYS